MSTATSLHVIWTGLSTMEEIGNSEILSYELTWDANSGTTNIKLFEGEPDQYSFLIQSLVAGLEYRFTVRAYNIYGPGEYSDIAILIPDAVPAMMNAVTTSLNYPSVTFEWVTPFSNGRIVTGY